MSDLSVGDTYKLLIDGVQYTAKIKEDPDGSLYVEWVNSDLFNQVAQSNTTPVSFSSSIIYGSMRELLVEYFNYNGLQYKGFIKATCGALDDASVTTENVFTPEGEIDSVVAYKDADGNYKAYITVDKFAFEMLNRVALVRVEDQRVAITFEENETETDNPCLIGYLPEETARLLYNNFKDGEYYYFGFTVTESSNFTGNETYYIDDVESGVSSNYGQKGIIGITSVLSETLVQLNPRKYKGADKLAFNHLNIIGNPELPFSANTVVVEESGRTVFARFTDRLVIDAFLDKTTTKVWDTVLTPKLGYVGSYVLPLIIKGPSIIWDANGQPLPVDIFDQWQVPINDYIKPTTALTSLDASRYGSSYLYLLDTSLQAVGMTVDLVTEQLADTGDRYIPVKYELPIVQHNSRPAIDLNSKVVNEGAKHNLLDWIWYLGLRSMSFGFELTPYGQGIEYIGDLLVKASREERGIVVNDEQGILRYPEWPVAMRDKPIDSITVADGSDDVTFHLHDVTEKEILIVQHEQHTFMAPIKRKED